MIDIRKLKELIKLMVENDLTELDLQDQEETVSLKRGTGGTIIPMHQPVHYAPMHHPGSATRDAGSSEGNPDSGGDDGLVAIESPMVGTFYAAASPDAPPLAGVGSSVSPDSVVCLVEAMKVFNEIKAEVSGTVERVLVANGDSVEFGQKLFLIRPA